MSFVITQACIGTKATECEKVCPVDCIHPGEGEEGFSETEQLFIDPKICINCGACMAVCPVMAVYPEEDVPMPLRLFMRKNVDYFRMGHGDFYGKYPLGKSRDLIQQYLQQQKASVPADGAS